MGQMSSPKKELDLELTNMKRNPYLADYTEFKKRRRKQEAQGEKPEVSPERVSKKKPTRKIVSEKASSQRNIPERSAAKRAAARERRRRMVYYKKLALLTGGAVILITAAVLGIWLWRTGKTAADSQAVNENEVGEEILASLEPEVKIQGISAEDYGKHPTWTEDFLTLNECSRPGDALTQVNSIFVHYTANPGTSAAQNRSYFEQLKDTQETSASAHFIIGYEGEIIQCIPLDEIAYAVQTRNEDSISIECCYLEEDGSFTQETYDSLINLLRWLIETYDLTENDILRHYDCGGKKCPLYYVNNEDAWEQLKRDVR